MRAGESRGESDVDAKPVHLFLLGGFRAECDARPLELSARKAKALLAFLALHPDQPLSRDRLATLLWEESGDSRARQSLRQALAVLRKALGRHERLLDAGADDVRLCGDAVDTDVAHFLRLAETPERVEDAVGLYAGDLLEGFASRAPGFEDWLTAERGRLRERALSVMSSHLDRLAVDGPVEAAVQLGLRLLTLDPLREPVHRLLMALYRRQGRVGAALRQYRRCQGLLQRELGVPPEADTQALYQRLLRERYVSGDRQDEATATAAASTPAPEAVAVRPALHHCVLLAASLSRPTRADDPEVLLSHSGDFHAAVERHVENLGGRVVGRLGDTALAVFGIPLTRGNEAQRAMHAAFALHETLAGAATGNSAAVGLSSGRVLVSGSPAAPQLTGEAVNAAIMLAAAAAGGETLAGDGVVQGLRNLVAADNADPPGTLPARRRWRLRPRPPTSVARPGFVGRRAERRQFIAAMTECLESGDGQSFLVRGEAGIGKTRLLEQVTADARERGFSTHAAAFLDFGGEVAEHGLRRLVCSLVGPGGASALQRLLDAGLLEPRERGLAADLLGLPQTAAELRLYDAMEPGERHAQLSALVARLVQRLARQGPLLVALEDVHWVEPHLLPYLSALGAAVAECPALFVMTSRIEGEPLDPLWRGSMRNASLTTIELGAMREEDALALAATLAGDDDARARRCAERAQGNPLFIEQLVRAADDASRALPDSVESVVWWRLDQLAPHERRLAQVASVLGQEFPRSALQELAAADGDAMRTLLGQRLLVAEGERLRFSHALLRDGIHASLLAAERVELHRRAARWFEDRDAVLHAEHLLSAGDARAAAAFERAAREQAALYRYDRAVRLAERGLSAAGERAARYRLGSLLGELQRDAGRSEASLATFRAALALAADRREQAHARIGMVAALRLLDRHEEAMGELDLAWQALGETADAREQARIWHYRGRLLFPMGRLDECLQAEQRALASACEAGSPTLEAKALSGLGDAWYQRGRMRTAREHYHRCVELARRHDLGRIEVVNLAMRGFTRFFELDMDGAVADSLECVDIAQRAGDRRAEMLGCASLALAAKWRDDLEGVGRWASRGLALARETGSRRFQVDNLCTLALLHARRGDHTAAERDIGEAGRLADLAAPAYCWPSVLAASADLAPDPESARGILARGHRYLDAGSISHNHFLVLQAGLESGLRFGDAEQVERYAAMLADYTRDEPMPWTDYAIERARALAAHGRAPGSVPVATLSALRERALYSQLQVAVPALDTALRQLRA